MVAGEQPILCDCVANLLDESGYEVIDATSRAPDELERRLRGVEATRVRFVVVLVDPVGGDWVEVARKVRSRARVGLVVLTARPSYALQRRWHQRAGDGCYLVDGLLSFAGKAEDVVDAVEWAYERPRQHSAFWLDGARHPASFHRTPTGKTANELRTRADWHETLLFEGSGRARAAARDFLGVKDETVGERLSKIRKLLGVKNDVQLGRRAAELGLFDDLDDYDWPLDEQQ